MIGKWKEACLIDRGWINVPGPAAPRGWFEVIGAEGDEGYIRFKLRGRSLPFAIHSSAELQHSPTRPYVPLGTDPAFTPAANSKPQRPPNR